MKALLTTLSLFLSITANACNQSDFSFSDDFSAARLDGCKKLTDSSYLLTINPENRPINSSPWYAFKIHSEQAKEIQLTIDYGKDKSRYRPKISHDGKHWQIVPHQEQNGDLTFKLNLKAGTLWVAAQEILGNDSYFKWLEKLETTAFAETYMLGLSTEGRSIPAFEYRSGGNEWVIVVGRMHPPEVTGAMALLPFVEQLLSSQPTAQKFRQRFNLLVIPNLNPDGVEHGNWRHNANGKDLNRDWGKFTQQETKLVKNKLEQIVSNGGKIVYAVDFHSTFKNIFYTMPVDYGAKPARLTEQWLTELEQTADGFKVEIKPGNNPGKGVFKQYIADRFGVHAITYEVADQFDRKQIKKIARLAANSFMNNLNNTTKSKF